MFTNCSFTVVIPHMLILSNDSYLQFQYPYLSANSKSPMEEELRPVILNMRGDPDCEPGRGKYRKKIKDPKWFGERTEINAKRGK